MSYHIEKSTKEVVNYIEDQLIAFNKEKLPFTQSPDFYGIHRHIHDENGDVIAGIITIAYCWNILNVDILWVHESHRQKGLGTLLLNEVEKEAREKGITMVHLDTFDFQAKGFYEKMGYVTFGTLDGYPNDVKRYYLSKKL